MGDLSSKKPLQNIVIKYLMVLIYVLISQKFRVEWCLSEAASKIWKKAESNWIVGVSYRCIDAGTSGVLLPSKLSTAHGYVLPCLWTERLNVFSMKK